MIIEVKTFKRRREAMGQILEYAALLPGRRLRVHLFDSWRMREEADTDELFERMRAWAEDCGVELTREPVGSEFY